MATNSIFLTKANAIADEVAASTGFAEFSFAADPTPPPTPSPHPFIDLIMKLLPMLLPLLSCFGGAAAQAAALQRGGPLVKTMIRRTVRKELHDDQSMVEVGYPLTSAILKVGRTTTAEEIASMQAAL